MEVAMPMAGNAIDCYEDMFKEITRKLYGEDGLPELGANDRLPNTQDKGLTPVDYDVESPLLKPEEHLTAFGLAALMQNGFPTPSILNPPYQQQKMNPSYEDKWIISEDNLQWTQSKIASYNPTQKLFRCSECDCVGYLPRVAEHWLGTHSNLRVFQCPQCPYESAWSKCVRMHLTHKHNISAEDTTDALLKNNPVLHEVTRYLQRLKSRLEINCNKTQSMPQVPEDFQPNSSSIGLNSRTLPSHQIVTPVVDNMNASAKRYSCSYCPYATDRRDLFTRHENIHREEKPFQCYVCQKQFNRADHVKKHFLRMHREHPYDLNRIRRHPPKNASGMSYYHKYNLNGTPNHSPEPVPSDLGTIASSISIPNGFNTMTRNMTTLRTSQDMKGAGMKLNPLTKNTGKKKGDKRFTCCYCSWSGVDNWCLKRHMNTHLKPFVCGLCDYKAARSERLATHVLKVHNKRSCGKCTFLADDPAHLLAHQQDHHPMDQRNNRSANPVLRNATFNNSIATSSSSYSQAQSNLKCYELNTTAAILQHGNRAMQAESKPWKAHTPKQHGAARLFNYLEASDSSEPEGDSRSAEEMSRMTLNHKLQSDFPEAGDVANQHEEEQEGDLELPLFVCKTCGCEFEDDASLETHQYAHYPSATSPVKVDDSKENVNPKSHFKCQVCEAAFLSQASIIEHMGTHTMVAQHGAVVCHDKDNFMKRSRKQSQPKKVVLSSLWDDDDAEVVRRLSSKLRAIHCRNKFANMQLYKKYITQLVARKKHTCSQCKAQYRSKGNLILHQYWQHTYKKHFQCEHCEERFSHRYQVVLHSSRVHVNKSCDKSEQDKNALVPTKEPTHSAVPVEELTQNFLSHSLATSVPEITNTSDTIHKLGMSFFDHPFLHTNTTINNHMPIIIPTFPPT